MQNNVALQSLNANKKKLNKLIHSFKTDSNTRHWITNIASNKA